MGILASLVSMSNRSSADTMNCASAVTRLVFRGFFSCLTTVGAFLPSSGAVVDVDATGIAPGEVTGVAEREGSVDGAFEAEIWTSLPWTSTRSAGNFLNTTSRAAGRRDLARVKTDWTAGDEEVLRDQLY